MKRTAAKEKGYTAKDMRAVSDNPKWSEVDFAKAKPFKKVFPSLRDRTAHKASTKKR